MEVLQSNLEIKTVNLKVFALRQMTVRVRINLAKKIIRFGERRIYI
jgi:hypothetical protein